MIHTEPAEGTWTKALQSFCCQIEVSSDVRSFLMGGGGGGGGGGGQPLGGRWPAQGGGLELLGYISCCFPYAVCWCPGPRARRAWALRLPEFAQLYPAGSLQWRFACGFDFRHGLPVVGGFAVLRGLLIVSVGTMSSF